MKIAMTIPGRTELVALGTTPLQFLIFVDVACGKQLPALGLSERPQFADVGPAGFCVLFNPTHGTPGLMVSDVLEGCLPDMTPFALPLKAGVGILIAI
jgi:hypothetical protein